jgi:hypothetical protein
MQQEIKQEGQKKKTPRYAVSVSARTYDRLRATVRGSLAGFVEAVVTSALDNPAILSRLLAKCPRKETRA